MYLLPQAVRKWLFPKGCSPVVRPFGRHREVYIRWQWWEGGTVSEPQVSLPLWSLRHSAVHASHLAPALLAASRPHRRSHHSAGEEARGRTYITTPLLRVRWSIRFMTSTFNACSISAITYPLIGGVRMKLLLVLTSHSTVKKSEAPFNMPRLTFATVSSLQLQHDGYKWMHTTPLFVL